MTKILIVEDEAKMAEELVGMLQENGYEAEAVADFDDTAGAVLRLSADLVLMDINIPGLNGEQVLKKVREKSQVPAIMLTSRSTEIDEVMSMSYGADDFVRKPYSAQVLLLRIEAVLNRMRGGNAELMAVGDLEIDYAKSEVRVGEKEVVLTKNELMILGFLAKNQGKIVSRAELTDYLWDDDTFVDDNTLTVNMTRLREKLEEIGQGGLIETRRGQGYILG